MTKADIIASKAIRASTLHSLKTKRKLRLKQIKEEMEEKVRQVNIQYADDPERLRAKYAADTYAKNERAAKKAKRKIAKEKVHIEYERRLRPYTLAEEIFNSIVQGLGVALFIVATVLLDVKALDRIQEDYKTLYFSFYTCFGSTMIATYLMSTLHHALPGAAKEVFSRLSHIGVFIVIATAYLSYSIIPIKEHSILVWVTDIIVWIVCFTGLLMYAIAGTRIEIVNIIFYAVLGWLGLLICGQVYQTVTKESFILLVVAGVIFTIGLILCALRKVKFMHAIGDLIILMGSICLFFSFFFIQ